MRNLFLGIFACLLISFTSCDQQPNSYNNSYQDNPDQYFSDPQYVNQPAVQYTYNGQQMLIDAALMAYLTTNHINPGYYYSTHRTYSHFHIYNNGYYSGYSRSYRPRYVTVNNYHYTTPNTRYVRRTVIRSSSNSYSPRRSSIFSSSSSRRSSSFGSSRPSRSSFGSSFRSSSRSSSRRR